MATTRLIPMHVTKGQSMAHTVQERLAYAMNPEKTNKGLLISAFGCDPATAVAEMLLCKKQHEILIGRADEDRSDVLLYQIRQSFKPGEIAPELAQKIGYELAMRFTKGRHQFVVTTHIDHAHIHNHIIFNATSIDGTHKFRNFMGSSKAIRGISDRLCLENGLSIVELPKAGHTHYGKWLGDKKPKGWHDKLRTAIDTILVNKPLDFDAFLDAMRAAGYDVQTGNSLAFRETSQKRFMKLVSLGEGYSEEDIRAVINGDKAHTPKAWALLRKSNGKINLLVELQKKLQEGKGAGYERWAKVFNLKQMAKTMDFLTENKITEYEMLSKMIKDANVRNQILTQNIVSVEKRLADINALRMHIINYSRTRNVFSDYRESGFSTKFYEKHMAEILLAKAAKEAFDRLPDKKVISLKALHEEYNDCLLAKKKCHEEYSTAKRIVKEVLTAKANIDIIFGYERSDHKIDSISRDSK